MRLTTKLLVIAVVILTFSNCKSSKKSSEKTDVDTVSSSSNDKPEYDVLGSQLIKNETIGELKIGLPLQKTIELFGEPDEKTKPELWGADGEYHHSLIYKTKGIEINIEGADGKKQDIYQISISESSVLKTKKKIGIGSTEAEVREAYKGAINPEFCNATTLVAGTIYGGLIFVIDLNKVTRITLGAVAE